MFEGLPVVGDDDDSALGGELPRNPLPLQAPRIRVPGDGFCLLGLAQAFQQPHPAAVGIEGIDVVDDDELVAVPVECDVHAKRRRVALDPACLAVEHGPHRAALGQPARADEDQKMEMPLGKSPEILIKPLVGRQMQHLMGLSPVAFFRGRHGVAPAVVRVPGRAESVPSKATHFHLDF